MAALGITLKEANPANGTRADMEIRIASTSPCGAAADGVLGCTTAAGQITIVDGRNWYLGDDPSAIGTDQYDFQTVVTHELGHALGLGHSHDTASAMYAMLSRGVTRRNLTRADVAEFAPRDDIEAEGLQGRSHTSLSHQPTGHGGCDCPLCQALQQGSGCKSVATNAPASHPQSEAQANRPYVFDSIAVGRRDDRARTPRRDHVQVIDMRPAYTPQIVLSDDDQHTGPAGDDVLIAGDGEDLMVGTPGRDVLIGGVGSGEVGLPEYQSPSREAMFTSLHDVVIQELLGTANDPSIMEFFDGPVSVVA